MKKLLLTTMVLLSAGIANASYIGYEVKKGFTESKNNFNVSAVAGHYHMFTNCPFYTDVQGSLAIDPDNGLSDWGIDAKLGTVHYLANDKTFIKCELGMELFSLKGESKDREDLVFDKVTKTPSVVLAIGEKIGDNLFIAGGFKFAKVTKEGLYEEVSIEKREDEKTFFLKAEKWFDNNSSLEIIISSRIDGKRGTSFVVAQKFDF